MDKVQGKDTATLQPDIDAPLNSDQQTDHFVLQNIDLGTDQCVPLSNEQEYDNYAPQNSNQQLEYDPPPVSSSSQFDNKNVKYSAIDADRDLIVVTSQPESCPAPQNDNKRLKQPQALVCGTSDLMCCAVLVTVCCCPVLGFIAVLNVRQSRSASKAGDMVKAKEQAVNAQAMIIAGIIIGAFVAFMYGMKIYTDGKLCYNAYPIASGK